MNERTTILDLLAIVLVGLVVNFCFLNRETVWGSHEQRHAVIAAEMMESHDYFVPRLLGELYPDKPPVMHNAIILLYRLTGRISMLLARIPSATAGIVGALALYGMAMLLYDRRTALFAGLSVLSIPGYVILSRIARPDMIFIATMLVASWLFIRGMKSRKRGSRAMLFAAAGVSTGISTLTKGPYGLLFPLIVVVLASFRRDDWQRPRLIEWLIFAVAFAFLLGVWAVPVYLRDHGKYLKSVIFQPDLVTLGEGPAGHTRRPFYWYLGPAPLYFLPWTLFLPFVVVDARRRYGAATYMALAVFVVLSSVPGKRDNYLGPWFPFAMLAVANSIGRREEIRWVRLSSRIMLGLSVLSIPLYYGWIEPRLSGPVEPERVFAENVMAVVPQGSRVIGFRGMGEAVCFINYERGHPHIVDVSEVRPPRRLLRLVERALNAGQPCYVMVMNRDLKIALDALKDERVDLIFEREVKKREYWKLYRVSRR
ncbi:MAG TPA: glycosyltransferase family 39 protein [Verrucomicrobiae bacterium]|nr:glycosyltransferase family 39 protein [Verrucomicrobiae bacterium]